MNAHASLERRSSGLPPTPTGAMERKGSWRPPLSEASAGSIASAAGGDPLLHRSTSSSVRGGNASGIQLEKTRRATVLNDKYILGEELGRGAYGQARGASRKSFFVGGGGRATPCALRQRDARRSLERAPTRRAARRAPARQRLAARTPPLRLARRRRAAAPPRAHAVSASSNTRQP